MNTLTPMQWGGAALLVVGILWWLGPTAVAKIRSWWPVTSTEDIDPTEGIVERMARLSRVQSDLEARGHNDESEMAGMWYAMLRDPVAEDKP